MKVQDKHAELKLTRDELTLLIRTCMTARRVLTDTGFNKSESQVISADIEAVANKLFKYIQAKGWTK